jgi:hypothetical protein
MRRKASGRWQRFGFPFTLTLIFTLEMKASATLERYYVLPCCLLLLNLCNEIIAYKAKLIDDGLLRTLCIMAMVLFGSSLVAFAVAPGIVWTVQSLRRTSRSNAGQVGEWLFLGGLGVVIFWLYYRNYLLGTEHILPAMWHNHGHLS